MTIRQLVTRVARDALADPVEGAPPVEFTVAPHTPDDAAAVLRIAAEHRMRVQFWGGGTHQRMGFDVEPDILVTSSALNQVVDWQHEDLTVVVQAGVIASDLETRLEERDQTAVLPETASGATIGGVVATGVSGWRRLRYGPTRDRMLEVRLATGDGRLIRGGGRVVKNVTGYDLPRLATGSFGSLGMITEMCLKLWPLATEQAMVAVTDPVAALRSAYRPLAVIETNRHSHVYLAGTAAELEAQAERVGGKLAYGHRWPDPLGGAIRLVMRMPPGHTVAGVEMVRELGAEYQAAHGVGEIRLAADSFDLAELEMFRKKVEAAGGAVVVEAAPAGFTFDPWGTPPDSVGLQRRVKAAFDPVGVANPGILPGGV
jgi:glycolate oxidase FAD binding subunit